MKHNSLFYSLLLAEALFAAQTAHAQQPEQQPKETKTSVADSVNGVVVDSEGEPLIGVTVKVAGTTNGVATDADGKFSLQRVPKGGTLEFSYIGKKTLRMPAGSQTMRVTMPDDENLIDDVVVTGYQTISKERATGSFAKVTADDLKTKRYSDLTSLLQGEVAGFNTGSGLIRGTTTMNGVSNPLYVIDGFPVESTSYDEYGRLQEHVPQLNVEDIESITVLKDAAAASIYGARAANGVVVIVTKKAKAGKKVNVSFNASFTWHPYSQHKELWANAADMVALEREWAAGNPNLQGSGAAAYASSLLENNAYPTQGIRNILQYYAGRQTEEQMNAALDELASRGYRYLDDVKKHAKRDAFYQQYNLGIGHASEKNNFTASISYRHNNMNDRFTNDNSWGIDFKDRLDITPWLHLEVGNYAYYQKATEQTYNVESANYPHLMHDGLSTNGTPNVYREADRLSQSDQDIIANNGLYHLDITPLDELGRNLRNTNTFINRTYGKLNFDLTTWLKYNVMFQYEYGQSKVKQVYDKESYYVRNLVDQYATADNGTTTFNVPYGNIYFKANNTTKAYTFRQQLNFEKTFGLHNIVALLGHEVRKNIVDYDNSTLYNYDPDMLTYALIDQNKLNNTSGLLRGYGLNANNFAYLRYVDNRYISFYANAAYTYDNRYMATANIRWDRSNLWGTSSKYQNKPIWGFGLGWNIDRESWFNASWIDRLKLRFSYGIAGNVAKNAAPYMTASYYPNYNVGGTYGSIGNRPNPNLRWEKTTTTNIALDFTLLHNRLSGSIEYYNKQGSDLLANTMGIPTEGFGYSTYQINNGKMRNRGVELTLNGQILRTNNLNLTATATYSYNKNTVTYVNVEAPVYYLQLDYPESYPRIGNPYSAIYAYRWAGLDTNGLPQVYDAEGNATANNPSDLKAITYAGTTEPTHLGSFGLNLSYKAFDFSMLWVYQGGHKMRSSMVDMLGSNYNGALGGYVTALGMVSSGIAHRWQKAGDEASTNVPRAVFAESPLYNSDSYSIYSYADINVINASNLRLANISASWQLPVAWISKAYLSSARIQLNIENVATFARSSKAKYMLGGYNAPNYVLGLYLNF